MDQQPREPHDSHTYQDVSFDRSTLEFYLLAVTFYNGLLQEDWQAIQADPDLKILLDPEARKDLAIVRELERIGRVSDWLKMQIQRAGTGPFGVEVSISHGTVRLIKSVGQLYIKHLWQSRNRLASRPNISRHALSAVDTEITRFEEKTTIGILHDATPVDLLVGEVLQEAQPEPTQRVETLAQTQRPRPVVIGTIEVLDADLRTRCLDLFEVFGQEDKRDRLDTVVSEAARVLEHRLRTLSGAPPTCTGVELASYCFGGSTPRLVVSTVPAEQEGVHLLFRGAFGFIRNPVQHKLMRELQPERVLQILALVDYLVYLAVTATKAKEMSLPSNAPSPSSPV